MHTNTAWWHSPQETTSRLHDYNPESHAPTVMQIIMHTISYNISLYAGYICHVMFTKLSYDQEIRLTLIFILSDVCCLVLPNSWKQATDTCLNRQTILSDVCVASLLRIDHNMDVSIHKSPMPDKNVACK